jgi:hypothetical protein
MPEVRQFSADRLSSRKRHCDSGWLILQSKCLLDEAVRNSNASALVYAALEARNAIEQLGFEIVMVCHGGQMPKTTFTECRKKGGVFDVLQRIQPDYRKLVQFTVLCTRLQLKAPNVVEWEIRRLRRLWNSLSSYCHAQLHASATVDDACWFQCGATLIGETYDYLATNMKKAATGLVNPKTMSSYSREIWNDFRRDKITAEQASTRLRLAQPLSAAELRGKRLVVAPLLSAAVGSSKLNVGR